MIPNDKFLSFDDYIKNPDLQGWVTVLYVAELDEEDSRFVFSALARPSSVVDLLKTPDHEVHLTRFGMPTFIKASNGVLFDPNNQYSEENIRLEPFVLDRNFHGVRPDTYEVVQDFNLYHDLFFDLVRKAYVSLDGEEIVQISSSRIRVREDALRDHLAARRMVLVLYYDHRRHRNVRVADVFGKDRVEKQLQGSSFNYDIVAGDYWNDAAFSRLVGKKIVRPYQEPLHRDYVSAIDRPESYETYVCLEDGERVEKSCDVESGRQPGPYLTPVFFKKKVLSEYHDKPGLYDVRDNAIWYLDLWYIEFGDNGDLIHAWLGDLGRIPPNEQKHWRQYNVAPRGNLEKNFARRQRLADCAPSRSSCKELLALKLKINDNFHKRFGFALFRDLPEGTAEPHDLDSDDDSEFTMQILNLAISLVETIDGKRLSYSQLEKTSKSLDALQQFLIDNGLPRKQTQSIVSAFRTVQSSRSSVVHLKGKNYEKLLQRLDSENARLTDIFAKIVATLREELVNLNDWLESGQDLSRPAIGEKPR